MDLLWSQNSLGIRLIRVCYNEVTVYIDFRYFNLYIALNGDVSFY